MRRRIINVILISACFIFLSCSEGFDDVDCSECMPDMPLEAALYIDVTLNEKYQEVPVIVFRGKLEQGDTIVMDTIYDSRGFIDVPLNEYYTVKAKYKYGNSVTYAIDGDEFNRYKIEGQCDGTCWIIRGGLYNVQLKYD
ncbi:MAG: hypothetical protein U9N53_07485 [Bacteroidota bacterium]|nr:hypothetical protein [Bacteroidota bacterium]